MTWLRHAADWFALRGEGYNFWSGIGSGSPIFLLAVGWWHHHNCHVNGCWRPGHPHPEHGQPICRKHRF